MSFRGEGGWYKKKTRFRIWKYEEKFIIKNLPFHVPKFFLFIPSGKYFWLWLNANSIL